ncbi:MAG: hypothetical protein ABSF90_31745 [Syntrophobacteraceae bacterium]
MDSKQAIDDIFETAQSQDDALVKIYKLYYPQLGLDQDHPRLAHLLQGNVALHLPEISGTRPEIPSKRDSRRSVDESWIFKQRKPQRVGGRQDHRPSGT